MITAIENDELMHYGVKGMKWGVRRYQNKDGSLTAQGKKHFSNLSDDKLQKELYKRVKKARAKQSGWSNQWAVSNTIGKNSKQVQDRYNRDLKAYHESDSYKKANKKLRDLNRKLDEGKIDVDEYDTEYKKIQKSIYKSEFDSSVTYLSNGRKYCEEYINSYGKDLNIGYLKDLGYNDAVAKEFTERILKSNKKMLNGM